MKILIVYHEDTTCIVLPCDKEVIVLVLWEFGEPTMKKYKVITCCIT
jgi:hypothetical protein